MIYKLIKQSSKVYLYNYERLTLVVINYQIKRKKNTFQQNAYLIRNGLSLSHGIIYFITLPSLHTHAHTLSHLTNKSIFVPQYRGGIDRV